MKITKRQLRNIIREAWNNPRWERTGANWYGDQFDKAFKQMHAFDADSKDIEDMEEIRDLFYEDLPNGEASPYLKRLVSGLDTIIREQIPQDVYYWIFPNLLDESVANKTKLISESRLPSLPKSSHSTDALHFWRSLASMAERDPDELIRLLLQKRDDDQRASRARWEESQRQIAQEMYDDEYGEY